MTNKNDYSMKNEWTRDDLPHQHEIWDNFVVGKHSDVFHAVDEDDLGEVLNEIVDYLNAHHPKSQQHDCGETIDALNRNRDALIENRDKSISSLQRLLANTECHEDRWRRAHEIVEAERDQARERLREAETKLAKVMSDYQDIEDERDEWKTSARLAEQERENWRITAINRAVPAVSRADVAEALSRCINPEMWNVTFPSVVSEVCDLFGVEAGQATDPLLDKAQEFAALADWELTDREAELLHTVARHVLGQEASDGR